MRTASAVPCSGKAAKVTAPHQVVVFGLVRTIKLSKLTRFVEELGSPTQSWLFKQSESCG